MAHRYSEALGRRNGAPDSRRCISVAEDDHPWVLENPRLTLVVMILRRIGYTLLTIFRSITQRSDDRRQEPWNYLLQRIRDAVLLGINLVTRRHTSSNPRHCHGQLLKRGDPLVGLTP